MRWPIKSNWNHVNQYVRIICKIMWNCSLIISLERLALHPLILAFNFTTRIYYEWKDWTAKFCAVWMVLLLNFANGLTTWRTNYSNTPSLIIHSFHYSYRTTLSIEWDRRHWCQFTAIDISQGKCYNRKWTTATRFPNRKCNNGRSGHTSIEKRTTKGFRSCIVDFSRRKRQS